MNAPEDADPLALEDKRPCGAALETPQRPPNQAGLLVQVVRADLDALPRLEPAEIRQPVIV